MVIQEKEILEELVTRIGGCVTETKMLAINIHIGGFELVYSFVPDNVENGDRFGVIKDTFELYLDVQGSDDFHIEYIGDDDTFYIVCDDMEIYFDFI